MTTLLRCQLSVAVNSPCWLFGSGRQVIGRRDCVGRTPVLGVHRHGRVRFADLLTFGMQLAVASHAQHGRDRDTIGQICDPEGYIIPESIGDA